MKKVLLIGADGMLGGELKERLEKKYEVTGTTIETLDITDRQAVLIKAKEINPDYVINCAAYTNVDGCEVNYDLANTVNGLAVENISAAAKENDSIFIHISTDYVFDGKLDIDKIYTEDMEPGPISAYGKTKLIGEENAAKAEKYYILRTAWLYGLGGKNFVKTMLKLSENHDSLNVVCDQHGSPTYAKDLTDIIYKAIEKKIPYGIYNATNEGFTTWYEFTKKIFEIAGKSTVVNPVTSEEYKVLNPASTDRPKNSMLSKEKLKSAGIIPAKWEDALKDYLKEELK